jgi:hypothetical protein
MRIFLYCLIGLQTSQGSQDIAYAYLNLLFRYARLIAEVLSPSKHNGKCKYISTALTLEIYAFSPPSVFVGFIPSSLVTLCGYCPPP